MFTLKLYRRLPALPEAGVPPHKHRKVMSVHRVMVLEIGKEGRALELWAFPNESNDYQAYYIGEPELGMDAYGQQGLHLDYEPHSWWGWGLLENWEGNTTEHYRPAGYG